MIALCEIEAGKVYGWSYSSKYRPTKKRVLAYDPVWRNSRGDSYPGGRVKYVTIWDDGSEGGPGWCCGEFFASRASLPDADTREVIQGEIGAEFGAS